MKIEITGDLWRDISQQDAAQIAKYIGVSKERLYSDRTAHGVMLEDGKLFFYAVQYLDMGNHYGKWQYTKAPKVW